MCFKRKKLFEKIRFSRQTIAHCTKELTVFVLENLALKAGDLALYSSALHKSMDIKDSSQVAIFMPGVDKSFSFNEQLAFVVPLIGTTKRCNV